MFYSDLLKYKLKNIKNNLVKTLYYEFDDDNIKSSTCPK